MALPAELRTAAWFYSQNVENGSARSRFEQQLQWHATPAMLVQLVEQFGSCPVVSIAALKRLVEVAPQNIGYLARLGMAHFMAGEDDAAANVLAKASAILPDDLDVLNLAAALARTDDDKRAIYARMLDLYPNNRAAFDNLVALRKAEEEH